MNCHVRIIAATAVVLAGACSDSSNLTAPSATPDLSEGRAIGQIASIMTRNVYIGFDADAAIAALATRRAR